MLFDDEIFGHHQGERRVLDRTTPLFVFVVTRTTIIHDSLKTGKKMLP